MHPMWYGEVSNLATSPTSKSYTRAEPCYIATAGGAAGISESSVLTLVITATYRRYTHI
jgi:hypothetical protein